MITASPEVRETDMIRQQYERKEVQIGRFNRDSSTIYVAYFLSVGLGDIY